MTEFDNLPPELAALDQQLTALPRKQPSDGLRHRVDASIEQVLQGEAESSWGWFAAAAAAVLLLMGNLSISAASLTYAHMKSASRVAIRSQTVAQLQTLLPRMSREEALRHAVLLDAAGRIVPYPKESLPVKSVEPIEME